MKRPSFHALVLLFVGVSLGALLSTVLTRSPLTTLEAQPPNVEPSDLKAIAAGEPRQASAGQIGASWLTGSTDERLAQIERQLRGFDVTMAEVGYRYDELVTASKNRNWDYAQYQTEKIDHTIRLGLERRPKRANSAQPFLNEIVPPLVAAIKAKRPEQLDLAVTNLHRGCIQCHRAENVLYMSERFASIHPTPEATIAAIEDYKRLLTPEYLASADLSQGRLVYSKHCGSCHRMFEEGGDIGPALTNLQRSNLDYLLKATVDPNSLIGFDYQTEVIVTKGGRVISGLVKQEGEDFVTIQTATDAVKVTRDEIEERAVSAVSLMPERLLQNLSSEQVRDLIAYLQGAKQVSLPVGQPE